MQLPQLLLKDLQPWMNKSDMIKDCALQTQKDLGGYGIHIEFSGNPATAFDELFSQIQPEIHRRLISSNQIQEILYRVDVDEKLLDKVAENDEPYSHSLTRLILWRELQKVVTRFMLSSGHSG